jgi:hypothetical protein
MSKVMGGGSKGVSFPKGGPSGKMFGRTGATPAKAGVTSKEGSGQGGKFAKGGSGHMFGRRGAQSRSPGSTGGM